MGNEVDIIERPVLYRDSIKDKILAQILDGSLLPGDHLVEAQWAQRYRISPSPVREAFRELETMGVVESIPYKGCFIKEISEFDKLHYYDVRMALELLAVKELSESALPALAPVMRSEYGKLFQAAAESDMTQFITIDSGLHQRIIEQSNNQFLLSLWIHCTLPQYLILCDNYRKDDLVSLAKNHLPYCEAVESGKKSQLSAAIRSHYKNLGVK